MIELIRMYWFTHLWQSPSLSHTTASHFHPNHCFSPLLCWGGLICSTFHICYSGLYKWQKVIISNFDNLQMKWNEAEMVALVGRRAADWEGKLTYRWVWLNSKHYILFSQNRIRCTFILTQKTWQSMPRCQFLEQFHSGHRREEEPLLNSKDIRCKASCSIINASFLIDCRIHKHILC